MGGLVFRYLRGRRPGRGLSSGRFFPASMTICDTMGGMGQAISVRLDDEASRALRSLEASGIPRSEAIRGALIESARRLRRRSELAAEVAAIEADESDRAEMLAVAGLMESLRAAR